MQIRSLNTQIRNQNDSWPWTGSPVDESSVACSAFPLSPRPCKKNDIWGWYYDDNDCNISPSSPHPFQVSSPEVIFSPIFTFSLHICDFLDDVSSIFASLPAAIVVDEVKIFVSTSLLLLTSTSTSTSAFWSHLQDLWRLVRLSLVAENIRFYSIALNFFTQK